MSNKIILLHLFLLFVLIPLSAQDDFSEESNELSAISGMVIDSKSGDPIAGANIVVDGGDAGAAADEDGKYSIDGVEIGASVTASAIGYEDITLFADSGELNFSLVQKVLELGALDVIAPKAKFRETPVAFTDVSKEELELRLRF